MNAETAARKRYDAAICWTTGRDIPEDACFEFAEWFMHSDVSLENAFGTWSKANTRVLAEREVQEAHARFVAAVNACEDV